MDLVDALPTCGDRAGMDREEDEQQYQEVQVHASQEVHGSQEVQAQAQAQAQFQFQFQGSCQEQQNATPGLSNSPVGDQRPFEPGQLAGLLGHQSSGLAWPGLQRGRNRTAKAAEKYSQKLRRNFHLVRP